MKIFALKTNTAERILMLANEAINIPGGGIRLVSVTFEANYSGSNSIFGDYYAFMEATDSAFEVVKARAERLDWLFMISGEHQ